MYEPAPFTQAKSGDKAEPATSPVAEPAPTTPSPSPTVDKLDICGSVTPERVQALLGKPKVPTAEPDKGKDGTIPGVGTISGCVYRWDPTKQVDAVTISVLPDSEVTDPQKFVSAILGEKFTAVPGAGDVAGVDRTDSFGHDIAALMSAKKTADGLVGVLIQSPDTAKDEALAALATEVFTKVE